MSQKLTRYQRLTVTYGESVIYLNHNNDRVPFHVDLNLYSAADGATIDHIYPKQGSLAGATYITISGEGKTLCSEIQYDYCKLNLGDAT